MNPYQPRVSRLCLLALMGLPMLATSQPVCRASTSAQLTPVIELYTSEGCSSCPPADQWLSTLKGKLVVTQAFHIGHWDYIRWADRFATAANTQRQKDIARLNGLRGIYIPQLVRNGRDWSDHAAAAQSQLPARATIVLQNTAGVDNFEARVTPIGDLTDWAAYWTVTEHGHSSHVKAGENAGETLRHDFVVRQYAPVGIYRGAQTLKFSAIAAHPEHPRQINRVISDPKTGDTLQGISFQCS